jgi:hypothetical protein
METFYETYKFLLLELSYDETLKRMDDSKFMRLITGKESIEDMSPLKKASYTSLKSTIIKSVPGDIPEKDKANALNWIITRIVKDNPDYPENRSFIRKPSDYWGREGRGADMLKKQLELFYQIKQQKMDRLLPKKAIEQYGSFEEFVKSIEEIAPSYREYLAQKTEKSTKGEGQLKVYDNNTWEIYLPQTQGAACALGKGTDWCTAAPGLDYYQNYAEQDQLIIFINKNDPEEKYQFHYKSGQFMDKNDVGLNEDAKFYYLNYILYKAVKNTEYEKYLSNETLEEIDRFRAHSDIIEVDSDHIFVTSREEGEKGFVKSIINTNTFMEENPYGPLIKIRYSDTPSFKRKMYILQNADIRRMYWITYRDSKIEQIGITDQYGDSIDYSNDVNYTFYNLAYFNTFKDVPESERPEKGDKNYFAKLSTFINAESQAKMVPREEVYKYKKYTDFGIESIKDRV